MNQIAAACGVAKSLIHHHFRNKDALWSEVKRAVFRGYYTQQKAVFASHKGDPGQLLLLSMKTYFRYLIENPLVVRMLTIMQLEGDIDCTEMVEELRALGIEKITAAQEAGVVRRDLPAPVILIAFLGLVQAWFSDPVSRTPEGKALEHAYIDGAWRIFSVGALEK